MAHAAVLAEKEEFCDAYFPVPSNPDQPKPVLKANPFAELAKLAKFKGNEAKIRAQFAKAVNDHNLIPGLVIRECSERPDPLYIDPNRQKVDAAWYFRRDAKDDKKQDWGNQVLPVEFKGDETADDPFDEEKENISTSALSRRKARGQMITYSELLHLIQQRVALFMLVVVGKRARFTRWDRSGTVVTRAFNYIEDWKFFCDILWRIGNCSATQLGFDPTATRLSEADPDWRRMLTAAHEKDCVDYSERVLKGGTLPEGEFAYVQDMFKHSLVPGWPCYRVEVPVEVSAGEKKVPDGEKKFRHFLIGKPTFRAKGMAGRGTRGYVALDCVTERFVWLKDAWRANYEFVEKEGNILAALNQAQVSNVPTMLCHGDINGQTTETPDWWEHNKQEGGRSTPASDTTQSSRTYVNSSSSTGLKRKLAEEEDAPPQPATKTQGCPLRLHQHYRLVVQEVAMPLDRFEYPQQLVQVIFDCVFAHYEAFTKPETPLLHRDISAGNILIYPRVAVNATSGVAVLRWKGILADWEMSKPKHKGDGPCIPRQPERTGTWQYLSIALLGPGDKLITLADELESFFHVFLYYALRYIRSFNCDSEAIANFLDSYFDLYGYEEGVYTCGALKSSTIKRGKISVGSQTLRFGNPLDKLFSKILSWFKAHYVIADHNKEVADKAKDKASASADPPTGSSDLRRLLFMQDDSTSDILAQFGPIESLPQPVEGPTKEDTALAEVLKTHNGLVLALGEALRDAWPDEKAEDQIPSGWKPPTDRFPQPPSKNVENKRKRIEDAKKCVSAPPQYLVTPASHAGSAGNAHGQQSQLRAGGIGTFGGCRDLMLYDSCLSLMPLSVFAWIGRFAKLYVTLLGCIALATVFSQHGMFVERKVTFALGD
ncbi:hypothetical protein LXA43DRAFT_210690 [Ganoderma leucocontextum]|nr:hypothetical protein LXA43DRAFT_210690 [Ganoderma leucocontextum]